MKKMILTLSVIGLMSAGIVAGIQTKIFPNFIAANLSRFRESADEKAILASGNVEVTEVNVGFTLAGRVTDMLAQEGQRVQKWDKLAMLDNAEMTSLVAQNTAALYESLAKLEELQSGSRTQEIGGAKASVTAVEAELSKAQKDLRRAEALYAQKLIPTSQLDAAKSAYDAVSAQYKLAKEKLSLTKEGPTKQSIRAAEYRVEQAKAALLSAEKRLSDTTIFAPLSGVILNKNVEPGEILTQGAPVYTIGDLENPWIKVYVKEDKLGLIKLGQTAEVTIDAFPNKFFDGAVTYISPQAEFTPKTVQTKEERVKLVFAVKVSVKNLNGELKPGMPADVRLLLN